MAEQSQLSQIENSLGLIARTLSNGYIDADTADELAREAYAALKSLKEYRAAQLPASADVLPFTRKVTVYEPQSEPQSAA